MINISLKTGLFIKKNEIYLGPLRKVKVAED